MIRNERLHVPEEGYKRGGKVKGKKKAKAKAKRKVTGKAKRGKKMALPPLTTGSMGIGQGSYQAVIQPSGGAFQAPSYFRAVGSSEQYASVPPVLREFVKQQEKMWEDLKKGKTTVDGTPMEDVSKATPVPPSSSSSSTATAPAKVKMSKAQLQEKLRQLKKEKKAQEEAHKAHEAEESEDVEAKEAVVGGGGLPYAFAPASGDVMKPIDAMIDAPSSSYAPLLASLPDDLSQSASASSAVASSASSAMASSERRRSISPQVSEEDEEEEEAGLAPPSQEQRVDETAYNLAKTFIKNSITTPHKLDYSSFYDKGRVEVMAQELGLKLPDFEGQKRVRRWKDVTKGTIAKMIFERIEQYMLPSSSSSSSSSSGAF